MKRLPTESNDEWIAIQLREEKDSYNIVMETRLLSIAVGQEHSNVEKLRASLTQLAANAAAKF